MTANPFNRIPCTIVKNKAAPHPLLWKEQGVIKWDGKQGKGDTLALCLML